MKRIFGRSIRLIFIYIAPFLIKSRSGKNKFRTVQAGGLQGGLDLIQLLLALVYLRAPVGKLTLGICQRLVHAGQHAAVQRVYFPAGLTPTRLGTPTTDKSYGPTKPTHLNE